MDKVSINKNMHLSEHLALPSEATLSHSSKLDGLRLSPHFTLGEVTKTSVKTADGNIPSRVHIENLKNLCENWLEDLRYSHSALYGERSLDCARDDSKGGAHDDRGGARDDKAPLIITSGYRSAEVNKAVGGSPTSNRRKTAFIQT